MSDCVIVKEDKTLGSGSCIVSVISL